MGINIMGLITIVVFVLILTAIAPTIIKQTYTGGCNVISENLTVCGLENASSGGKAMYGLMELLYPVLAIFGILAVVGIGRARG